MSSRILRLGAGLLSAAFLGAPVGVAAETGGFSSTSATTSGSTIIVGASADGASGTPEGSSAVTASAPVCTWTAFSPEQQQIYNTNANSGELLQVTDQSNLPPAGVFPPPPGVWGMVSCPPLPPYLTWVPTGGAPPSEPSPSQVARSALARLHLGAPQVGMAPPPGKLVVNLQTYLWVDPSMWRSMSASASVGGVSATVVATPSRVVWTMGDGDTVTCNGPGVPYDAGAGPSASNCAYTYTTPSGNATDGRYVVTAKVYWHVTWTSAGVAGGGDLGDVPGEQTSTSVEVDVIRAVNR